MAGDGLFLLLAGAQAVALGILVVRLSRGRRRIPPVAPGTAEGTGERVSIVIPARNEAARIGACLRGLRGQGSSLAEVIVVDGGSTDGTADVIDAASVQDARVRRMEEPPRPPGAVGRPWAITAGCAVARSEWVMVVDADVTPNDGMVGGAVAAACQHGLDAVSFAPRIRAPSAGARWLQPAFLATLVYRFGPTGTDAAPDRVMANGQCQLMRRAVLEGAGGYGIVARSFCDDISIMRHLATRGARVGFLDGRQLLDVVMYPTGRETWRAWPRSLNMRDATGIGWRWLDALFLLCAQALPVPMLLALAFSFAFGAGLAGISTPVIASVAAINAALLVIRLLVAWATAPSFASRGAAYWLAPLADAAVVARLVQTMVQRPREWRGAPRPVTASA